MRLEGKDMDSKNILEDLVLVECERGGRRNKTMDFLYNLLSF